MDAMRRCTEGAFFLTASLRPVILELVDDTEDDDGLQEKMLPKRSQEFGMEREVGIRAAGVGGVGVGKVVGGMTYKVIMYSVVAHP